jgi:hypothetical protein
MKTKMRVRKMTASRRLVYGGEGEDFNVRLATRYEKTDMKHMQQ